MRQANPCFAYSAGHAPVAASGCGFPACLSGGGDRAPPQAVAQDVGASSSLQSAASARRRPASVEGALTGVALCGAVLRRAERLRGRRHRRACVRPAQLELAAPSLVGGITDRRVRLGHDGSSQAAEWIQGLRARRLLTPNVELLSPLGQPSPLPDGAAGGSGAEAGRALGRVFALLPDGRLLRGLEAKALASDPPSIGIPGEWASWDYAMTLLGSEWRDFYAWEYWRFLQPPGPQRAEAVASGVQALENAAARGIPGQWWREGGAVEAATAMLNEHGFCVWDDFLPAATAEAIASSALAAWSDGTMASGTVSSGSGSFARGDSVLWVNTEDPSAFASSDDLGRRLVPKDGLSSAAVPALGSVLASIDALVAEVIAPKLHEARTISTRSHAMFTCYPALGEASGPQDSARGYLRHVDNEGSAGGVNCDNGRVLTTILYLNDGWESHNEGQLRFFEHSPPLQVRGEVLPRLNRLVAFWSAELPHEVVAPLHRDRFACTFWYLDRAPGPSAVAFEGAPASLLQQASVAVARAAGGAGLDFVD
mmetsp:Transcript_16523/g.57866  ORF Transcript_16523/g.57866 Transcript_16523/m.57866 type:complete len:540 (-) Transcript_16523:244-1863(-)